MKFSSGQIVILALLATICFVVWYGPDALKTVKKVDKKIVNVDSSFTEGDSTIVHVHHRDTTVVGMRDTTGAEWMTAKVTNSGGGKVKIPVKVIRQGTWGDEESKVVVMALTDDKFWRDKD